MNDLFSYTPLARWEMCKNVRFLEIFDDHLLRINKLASPISKTMFCLIKHLLARRRIVKHNILEI